MEEFRTRAVELPVSCPGQEWRGLRENCVSFCPKHQGADRNGPCITGGSCRLWKAMHQHHIYLRLAFPRLTRNNKEIFIIRKTIVLLRGFSGIPADTVFLGCTLFTLEIYPWAYGICVTISQQRCEYVAICWLLCYSRELSSIKSVRHPRLLSEQYMSFRSVLNTVVWTGTCRQEYYFHDGELISCYLLTVMK